MPSTLREALEEIRGLHPADAGAFRGVNVRYHGDRLRAGLITTPYPWAQQLARLIAARETGTVTADTPEYIVCSGGIPVAWLTIDGAIRTPGTELTSTQAKHQRLAVEALGDLYRHTLQDLADRRDERDGRADADTDGSTYHDHAHAGALRVASPADPTRSAWVRIGPDHVRSAATITAELRCGDAPLLILDAPGYGGYGRHAHPLDLRLLCAMHAVARERHLSLTCVGDWIDTCAAAASPVTADALPQRFRDAYAGHFASREDYTSHRMNAQGWTAALHEHGMERYFDERAYRHHLFTAEVTAVESTTGGRTGIAVFRRHQ